MGKPRIVTFVAPKPQTDSRRPANSVVEAWACAELKRRHISVLGKPPRWKLAELLNLSLDSLVPAYLQAHGKSLPPGCPGIRTPADASKAWQLQRATKRQRPRQGKVTIIKAPTQRKQKPVRQQVKSDRPIYRPGMPSTDFWLTQEWMSLRYQTISKHGARCQCCGATPQSGAIIQVDHIRPRSRYPSLELDPSNLQILCRECNLGKLDRSSEDWRT